MSEPFVTVLREIEESPDSFSIHVIASWCGKAATELERLSEAAAEIEQWSKVVGPMYERGSLAESGIIHMTTEEYFALGQLLNRAQSTKDSGQ
jgi:hypothetical protein